MIRALLVALVAIALVGWSSVRGDDPVPLAQDHTDYTVTEDGTPEIVQVGWSIYANPTEGNDIQIEVTFNGAPNTFYNVDLFMLTDNEETFVLVDTKGAKTTDTTTFGVATVYFTVRGLIAADGWMFYVNLYDATKVWDTVDPIWLDKP